MTDLLALSTKIIDEGITDEPTNRITHELSELSDDIAIVEAFSHSVLFRTDDGLVVFDTSGIPSGSRVVRAIRGILDQQHLRRVSRVAHSATSGQCRCKDREC